MIGNGTGYSTRRVSMVARDSDFRAEMLNIIGDPEGSFHNATAQHSEGVESPESRAAALMAEFMVTVPRSRIVTSAYSELSSLASNEVMDLGDWQILKREMKVRCLGVLAREMAQYAKKKGLNPIGKWAESEDWIAQTTQSISVQQHAGSTQQQSSFSSSQLTTGVTAFHTVVVVATVLGYVALGASAPDVSDPGGCHARSMLRKTFSIEEQKERLERAPLPVSAQNVRMLFAMFVFDSHGLAIHDDR